MDAIVYESNTGYTKKYAEMLSELEGIPAFPAAEAGEELQKKQVVFMGWLRAGGIYGIKKALKKYDVRAVCCVGMGEQSEKQAREAKEKYRLDIPVFYLQGGFDYSKLKGINKFMMKTMINTVGKKLAKKPDLSPEEADAVGMLTRGGDRTKAENLAAIREWLKNNA